MDKTAENCRKGEEDGGLEEITTRTSTLTMTIENEEEDNSQQQGQGQSNKPTSNRPHHLHQLHRSEAIDEEKQLLDFLRETMGKSLKDRNIILRIESDLVQFVKDGGRTSLPFPSMSSYHRMLVHRISSLFNLDHNIDPIGNCVVVSKNNSGAEKLLDFRFRELLDGSHSIGEGQGQGQEGQGEVEEDSSSNSRRVLRRENSSAAGQSQSQQQQQQSNKQKTFEQRSLDYHRARHRIFHQQQEQQNPINHKPTSESFDEGRYFRNKQQNTRNSFYKSSSFGGYQKSYGSLPPPPQLTTQTSLSPASSGYKSLQIMSTSTSCSSSQDYFCDENGLNQEMQQQQQQYNTVQSVPPPQQQQVLQQIQPHPLQRQQIISNNYSQQYIYPPPQVIIPQMNSNPNVIYYVPITQQQLQNQLLLQQQQQQQMSDSYWMQQQLPIQLQQHQLQQQHQQYYHQTIQQLPQYYNHLPHPPQLLQQSPILPPQQHPQPTPITTQQQPHPLQYQYLPHHHHHSHNQSMMINNQKYNRK